MPPGLARRHTVAVIGPRGFETPLKGGSSACIKKGRFPQLEFGWLARGPSGTMVSVFGRLMDQFYCDWCYDEMTPESMARSRQLGLCDRDCCACDRCLDRMAYGAPPKGWARRPQGWSRPGSPE